MDSSQLHSTSGSVDMGEANEGGSNKGGSKEIENLSLETFKPSRDLLRKFLENNPKQSHQLGRLKTEEEDIELILGLSLGGQFGVDKSHKGLIRSSSVSGALPLIGEENTAVPLPAAVPSLVRTASLPSEMDEWRKRKEIQTLRRMEAKRRRSEKQRNSKESGDEERGGQSGIGSEGSPNLNVRVKLEKERFYAWMTNKSCSSSASAFCLPNRVAAAAAAAAKKGRLSGGNDVGAEGKRGCFGSLHGLLAQRGYGDSHGASFSGASELESKQLQGSGAEGRFPAITHSLQHRGSPEATGATVDSGSRETESSSKQKQLETADGGSKRREIGTNSMEDMPAVFTIGDGPNGRKVDGILYKYGKGEEVRIMCVCHGKFFSPAEFIKHAGGRDVEHPLRHIVVNPSSSPLQWLSY
ncbi:hypothetical protein Nepgr_029415 [Nepenthes gracilis]|uniref:Ninja-family protein n=1 Tax=Nepenthes gracilis TaxID=150966 RepID=A0AAD3TFC0_NEPGR|nr:hypothetical protein Nepgr_029415 [Nepenthes gracilis]